MVKKMIYLEPEMQKTLERVAHAQNKSVSQVIREAIADLFRKKEVYDLVEYDRRMAEYLGNQSLATPFRGVMDADTDQDPPPPKKAGQ